MFSLFYYSISFDQEIKSKSNYNNVTSISTHTEESNLFYYLKKTFIFSINRELIIHDVIISGKEHLFID